MIRLYHVSKRYGDQSALNDVNLHVAKGEFVYVTGPSGAGKTTLLKLLHGAIRPTSGKMLVGGIDIAKMGSAELYQLRRNMGIVFQDFKLIPRRTVAENIGLALEVIGTPREQIGRRVAVARAIVNDPSIVLADEPTGNLDGAMAIEVMEILQAINLRGTTVLVATHDAGLMQRFPFRVLRFRAGRLSEGGP